MIHSFMTHGIPTARDVKVGVAYVLIANFV